MANGQPSWLRESLRRAAWAPLLVLAACIVAGRVFHVYQRYPWSDMPSHFCGGFALGHFYFVSATCMQQRAGPIAFAARLLLALGGTMITAVVWEWLEYLCDLFAGTHMNHGVADTLSNLFFGLLGAVVFVLFKATLTRS